MDANAIRDALRSAVPAAHNEITPSIDMPAIVVDRDSWHDAARVLHSRKDQGVPCKDCSFYTKIHALLYCPKFNQCQ